jgi:energy-coupling factor transport system ATP-binding protein
MSICLNNLSFAYPPRKKPLITGMELTIESASWIAVIGPDGSGKTTLGKLIKGLLTPDSGSIRLDSVESLTAIDVGYVGGDPYDSFVGTSVEEDIVFGLENLQFPPTEIKRRLDLALGWTGLIGKEKRLIHSLSGGEQQRVALAGILAMGARVLVIDEALGMLDKASRIGIRSLLNSLRSDLGLTIFEITQDLEDAMQCERILFLADGSILFDGTASAFVSSPLGTSWFAMAFGLSGLLGALSRAGVTTNGLALRAHISNILKINISK